MCAATADARHEPNGLLQGVRFVVHISHHQELGEMAWQNHPARPFGNPPCFLAYRT